MKPVLVEKYLDVRRRPQTIAWYAFAVKPIVNRTMQLDEQEFKLLTNIRHLYVPRCLISIICMIIYLNCAPSNFTGSCRQVSRWRYVTIPNVTYHTNLSVLDLHVLC